MKSSGKSVRNILGKPAYKPIWPWPFTHDLDISVSL